MGMDLYKNAVGKMGKNKANDTENPEKKENPENLPDTYKGVGFPRGNRITPESGPTIKMGDNRTEPSGPTIEMSDGVSDRQLDIPKPKDLDSNGIKVEEVPHEESDPIDVEFKVKDAPEETVTDTPEDFEELHIPEEETKETFTKPTKSQEDTDFDDELSMLLGDRKLKNGKKISRKVWDGMSYAEKKKYIDENAEDNEPKVSSVTPKEPMSDEDFDNELRMFLGDKKLKDGVEISRKVWENMTMEQKRRFIADNVEGEPEEEKNDGTYGRYPTAVRVAEDLGTVIDKTVRGAKTLADKVGGNKGVGVDQVLRKGSIPHYNYTSLL